MEDHEFTNLGAEEQTRELVRHVNEISRELTIIERRFLIMGETTRAMDIREAKDALGSAIEEVT